MPKGGYSAKQKEQVLAGYQERMSLRGAQRVFHVWRQTIIKWLMAYVEQLPPLAETLSPAQVDDALEFDEAWSFVERRDHQQWLWTVLCWRTRQIVAFFMGDHSQASCRRLWQAIPETYRTCRSYRDFWRAYAGVLPSELHHCVGKESGLTAHQERWYCTLRQRLAHYVRQTLSFSKKDAHHDAVTRWFITEYNLLIRSSFTA